MEKFNPFGDPKKMGQTWNSWKKNFEHFLIVKDINSDQRMLSALLFSAGSDVQRIYEDKKAAADENRGEEFDDTTSVYQESIELLDSVFLKSTNESFQRAMFRRMAQAQSETVMAYSTRLREQAAFCKFGDLAAQENAIKDQIMDKGKSDELRRAMWKKDRDLSEMLTLAQSLENAQSYETNFKEKPSTLEVNKILDEPPSKRQARGDATPISKAKCWACGRQGHKRGDTKCPAKAKSCLKCKRHGHFSICCPSNKPGYQRPYRWSNVRAVEEDEGQESLNQEDGTDYVFNVSEGLSEYITCEVGGVPIKMVIDSGTKRNLIPLKTWEFLKSQKVKIKNQAEGSDVVLKAYGQENEIPVKGRFLAETKLNGVISDQWFYVVLKGNASLLGKDAANLHKVLKIGENINAIESEKFPSMTGKDFMGKW